MTALSVLKRIALRRVFGPPRGIPQGTAPSVPQGTAPSVPQGTALSVPQGTARLSGMRLGLSIGALAIMPFSTLSVPAGTALSVPQGTLPQGTLPPWQSQPAEAQLRITQIDRSHFPEIRVYVSATDASGEPVPVSADDLRLFENGEPVEPESILGAGEVGSLTTMLVIDISGSMDVAGKLDAAKSAALAYVDQMEPGDQAGLIAFDVESTVVQPVTEDRQALATAIQSLKTGGDTAMFDALVEGIRQLQPVAGRKAIIVLTDGMDNSSTATLDETLGQIGSEGLSIAAVGLGDRSQFGASFAGLDEARLESLAERAGGVYTRTADAAELKEAYQRLGRALHSEYVVTYTSAVPLRDGVNRTLDVRLASSAAAASGRYNPGGVVPEVAQTAPWTIFGLALAVLAALLLLPALIRLAVDTSRRVPLALRGAVAPPRGVPQGIPRRTESQPASRVRLHEAEAPAEQGRIRLH